MFYLSQSWGTMETTKVLAIIPRNLDFPPSKGDGVRVLEQCIDLSKIGLEVHLVFFGSRQVPSRIVVPSNIRFCDLEGDVSISRLKSMRSMIFLIRAYFLFLVRLIKYARSCSYGSKRTVIMHAHTPEGGLMGAIVKFVVGLPLVYDPHDWYYEDWILEWKSIGTFTKSILRMAYKALSLLVPRISDATLVLNTFMLERVGSTRKAIVPNYFMEDYAVGVERHNRCPEDVIVFVGSMVEWQGVDLLLRAFSFLEKEMSNASLWLVGNDECLDYYRQLASMIGLRRIKFWGRVPRREALDLISQASVCVIPFRRRRFCLTACPLKGLEYMSRNKSIVASDLPGIREVLRGYGKLFLFQAENEESLYRAMKDALNARIDNDCQHTLVHLRNTALRNLLSTYRSILSRNRRSALHDTWNHVTARTKSLENTHRGIAR